VNGATGTVAAVYEYSPYGELLRNVAPDSAAAGQPFRFSTKFTDEETGLVYYGRRYYQPANGRFLGRDPIEEMGGLNLYGFCGNNAINRWDVLGMDPPGNPRYSGDTYSEVVVINGVVYNRTWTAVGSGNEGDEVRWGDPNDEAVGTLGGDGVINLGLGGGGGDTRGMPEVVDFIPPIIGVGIVIAGNNPVIGSPPRRVRVEIGYTPIYWNNIPLPTSRASHAFIILTDLVTGAQYATRAGPTRDFQKLVTRSDDWTRNFVDTPKQTVKYQLVGTLSMTITDAVAKVTEYASFIDRQGIPYAAEPVLGADSTGAPILKNANSNSYAFSFLEWIGLGRPKPALTAPGWNIPLPVPVASTPQP
ncbi:MAG: RHS repeat-associated core domain-containing protein, partial [Verrucomicrobia bacterium]|nr:RHS repeat-associated core domain-containing protein [Verrucomicrobiota bacterium]